MMALIRLGIIPAMLAAVDKRKIVNVIVPTPLVPAHPWSIRFQNFFARRTVNSDGSLIQDKEKQSKCSGGAYDEGDNASENEHQDEVNGDEKNNGHHPIDATAHLEPSARFQQVAWLRDQFRKHRDSPVVRIGPQNIR